MKDPKKGDEVLVIAKVVHVNGAGGVDIVVRIGDRRNRVLYDVDPDTIAELIVEGDRND